MSRFIDRLKQLIGKTTQPIGFRPGGQAVSRLKIQIVGLMTDTIPDTGLEKDADAVIVRRAEDMKPAGANCVPYGIQLKQGNTGETGTPVKTGADFLVFPTKMKFDAIPRKGTGKILEVDSRTGEMLLRAVNGLPIDAVLVTHEYAQEAFCWQDLLEIQRITGLISKPLLVTLPGQVTADDLQALWAAGVAGVVVEVTGKTTARIGELRKMIEGLEYPDTTLRERASPLAPRITAERREPEEEEEEDE